VRLPWTILVLALLLPTAGALVYFVVASPTDPLFRISYSASKVIQFALPVVALLALDRRRLAGVRISTRGLSAGLIVGLGITLAILSLYSLGLRNSPLLGGLRDQIHAKVSGFGLASPAGFVVIAVFLSAIHAYLEEYYWRWFVHAGLRERLSQPVAIAVSSLAFAAHHVVVLAVYFPDRFWTATLPFAVAVAVGGAIWAWLYDRYQSLAGPWVAHLLTDAAIMAVGYDLLFR
jgi:CAAX protease family protein